MTTSPVHRQPPLTALLLSMVASMGDHQGHSALPTAGARCECLKWMRVGDGRCPNSFRATGDNSVLTQAAAGVTGDNNYGNTATNSGDGTQTVAFADVIGEGNYDNTATATNTGTISGGGRVMASAGSVRPSAPLRCETRSALARA